MLCRPDPAIVPVASWFETRGVAARLAMRVQDLILRSGVSRVSKDEATELGRRSERAPNV
jgi:hypothetical protein